jgi:hypothetical protein
MDEWTEAQRENLKLRSKNVSYCDDYFNLRRMGERIREILRTNDSFPCTTPEEIDAYISLLACGIRSLKLFFHFLVCPNLLREG